MFAPKVTDLHWKRRQNVFSFGITRGGGSFLAETASTISPTLALYQPSSTEYPGYVESPWGLPPIECGTPYPFL